MATKPNNIYKKKPRIKREGNIATINIVKGRAKKMTGKAARALRDSLDPRTGKRGRPKRGSPVIEVTNPPMGPKKHVYVKEVTTVKLDMTPDPPRKKVGSHGKPFEKGNPNAWKPGQSGNPRGIRSKGQGITVISKAYTAKLRDAIPKAVAEELGFDPDTPVTFAEALAMGMLARAITHDTSAAKEIREVTEGRLPETLSVDGKIDYTAGESGKERLLGKLMGTTKTEETKE